MCNMRESGHGGRRHGGPHHGGPHHCGPGHHGPMHFGPPMGRKFFHKMRHKWKYFMPHSLEETKTEYIIKILLPGFDVEQVDVSVKENLIFVEAKKPEAEETEGVRVVRGRGKFLWNKPHVAVKIFIDEKIKPETVKAKLAKGILTITVEKVPGTNVEVEE